MENRNIEEAIRNTTDDIGQSLDGSLTAMEDERSESDFSDLHKAVQLLQNQIGQLENGQAQKDSETNARKVQLESELENARTQLHDWRQRVDDLNFEIVEMQQKLTAVTDEKNSLENTNSVYQFSEQELKNQLEGSQSDKREVKNELHEIQQRLTHLETERRDWMVDRERWERERLAFENSIDSLEMEKRRIEEAIRDRTVERQALDKSLTAMERENSDLHKAVPLLQNQVAKLENGQAQKDSQTNARKVQMESKLESARTELHDWRQRVDHLNSRIVEMQRQLTAVTDEKSSLENILTVLQNTNAAYRSSERELKNQLVGSQSEKRQAKDELHEMQQRMETERRDWVLHREHWGKERLTLKKTIDSLELEKRRIDEAIRYTTVQMIRTAESMLDEAIRYTTVQMIRTAESMLASRNVRTRSYFASSTPYETTPVSKDTGTEGGYWFPWNRHQ